MKGLDAKTLRAVSLRLRKEAKLQRSRPEYHAANVLDHFADAFLLEAQALEKKGKAA